MDTETVAVPRALAVSLVAHLGFAAGQAVRDNAQHAQKLMDLATELEAVLARATSD